jgi:hypothetical protein
MAVKNGARDLLVIVVLTVSMITLSWWRPGPSL